MVTGLAVHMHGHFLGGPARDILGDALWAAMIVWLVALIAPAASVLRVVVIALAVCFAVELSQLVRAAWLMSARRTTLGHLVLGSDFDARDLLAYTVGAGSSLLLLRVLPRYSARSASVG